MSRPSNASVPWSAIGGAIAFLSTSGFALYKYVRHERRQLIAAEPPMQTPSTRPGVELLPFRWEVNLSSDIPDVTIVCWAVNYGTKSTKLKVARATYFQIRGTPAIERIVDIDELEILASSSRQLLIRRALIDSEARAIRERAQSELCEAEMRLAARWEAADASGHFNDGANYVRERASSICDSSERASSCRSRRASGAASRWRRRPRWS